MNEVEIVRDDWPRGRFAPSFQKAVNGCGNAEGQGEDKAGGDEIAGVERHSRREGSQKRLEISLPRRIPIPPLDNDNGSEGYQERRQTHQRHQSESGWEIGSKGEPVHAQNHHAAVGVKEIFSTLSN